MSLFLLHGEQSPECSLIEQNLSSQLLISFLQHARKPQTHRSPLLSAQVGDTLNPRLSRSAGRPKRGDTSVLETEIRTQSPLFPALLPLTGPHLSHQGRKHHCREDKHERRTSARWGQIRADFCPDLSGITPVLPIRLQARAGPPPLSPR